MKPKSSYLSATMVKRQTTREAAIAKRMRKLLSGAVLGEAQAYHATILAEGWRTMSSIAGCIETFSREKSFLSGMEKEPMDFFTEVNTELTLLRSRTKDLQKTINALLASYYRLKR